MRSVAALALATVVFVACRDHQTAPTEPVAPGPAFAIADGYSDPDRAGVHWLFPIRSFSERPPHNNPFDPDLPLVIEICQWDGGCTPGGLFRRFFSGASSRDWARGRGIRVFPELEEYSLLWLTAGLRLDPNETYRIRALVGVGGTELAFADVDVVRRLKELGDVDRGEFAPLVRNRVLPIRLRVEEGALCDPPGAEPCVSETIDLTEHSSVELRNADEVIVARLDVPAQPQGGQAVITLQLCDDLNPRATDLPTFGPCIEIRADPPLSGLMNPATISLCTTQGVGGVSPAQHARVTVVRFDDGEQILVALPHDGADCSLGFGGTIDELDNSDFQGVLPAQMDYEDAADAYQTVAAGTQLPIRVLITDVGDPDQGVDPQAVAGATVHFEIVEGPGSLSNASDISDANGVAEVILTAGLGHTVVRASARGVADPDDPPCNGGASGPCTVNGVFAPDHALGPAADPVEVGEGTLDFTIESRIVWAASGQGSGNPPSDLFQVEAFAAGADVLIGRLRTDHEEPVIADIARSPSGDLFAISFTELYHVDAGTAMLTKIGDLGLAGANALAFDPAGNLFGATLGGQFFQVNTTTGLATILGRFRGDLLSQGDIAFAPDGSLFGAARLDDGRSVLVEIEPAGSTTPGLATVVGPIGVDNVFGLAFVGNQLYGLTAVPSGDTGHLITIDRETGAGAHVRALSFNSFGAAASSVPDTGLEPGSN